MSLNVTTSSVGTTSQVSTTQTSENTKKSSTDSSFKDEIEKASTKEAKKDTSTKEVESKKSEDSKKTESQTSNKEQSGKLGAEKTDASSGLEQMKHASLSMIDVNNSLRNDIELMMNNTNSADLFASGRLNTISDEIFGEMLTFDCTNNMFMTQSDAEFFINLAQNDKINHQAIASQAQIAFENGTNIGQLQQNVKISETLLNAINIARENNQPIRIDFDQNIAVILRMGKDGSFAANFIPGDKVVEQYLKNNLDSLKSAFQEKDIPYTDLSYSNRGSKHQKEQQRNKE